MSAIASFLPRAAPAISVIFLAMPRMFSPSASRTTGTTRPCWSRSTAMPRLTYGCSVIVPGVDVDRGVDGGVRPQRVDRRPGHERQVGQRRAGLGLEPVLQLLPHPLDVVEVDLHRGPHGRRERLGGLHARRHRQAHAGELDDLVAAVTGRGSRGRTRAPRVRPGRQRARGPPARREQPRAAACGGRCLRLARARGDRALHVLAPDPAALAGTGDRGDVEPGLRHEAAHQWREHPAVAVGGRGRARRRRGGRCGSRLRPRRRSPGWRSEPGPPSRRAPRCGPARCRQGRSRPRRRGSRSSRRRTGWGSPSRPCRWTPRRAGRRTPPYRRPACARTRSCPR